VLYSRYDPIYGLGSLIRKSENSLYFLFWLIALLDGDSMFAD